MPRRKLSTALACQNLRNRRNGVAHLQQGECSSTIIIQMSLPYLPHSSLRLDSDPWILHDSPGCTGMRSSASSAASPHLHCHCSQVQQSQSSCLWFPIISNCSKQNNSQSAQTSTLKCKVNPPEGGFSWFFLHDLKQSGQQPSFSITDKTPGACGEMTA